MNHVYSSKYYHKVQESFGEVSNKPLKRSVWLILWAGYYNSIIGSTLFAPSMTILTVTYAIAGVFGGRHCAVSRPYPPKDKGDLKNGLAS